MKIAERFNIDEEYQSLIKEEMKTKKKSKNEVINDILFKYYNDRDNRLSNHIARDTENLMIMLLMSDKKYSSIEEIKKEANIINNDKKIFLSEKKNKEVGFFKDVKKVFNFENFKRIHTNYSNSKDDKSKKQVLEKAFQSFLSIVKKYENE